MGDTRDGLADDAWRWQWLAVNYCATLGFVSGVVGAMIAVGELLAGRWESAQVFALLYAYWRQHALDVLGIGQGDFRLLAVQFDDARQRSHPRESGFQGPLADPKLPGFST